MTARIAGRPRAPLLWIAAWAHFVVSPAAASWWYEDYQKATEGLGDDCGKAIRLLENCLERHPEDQSQKPTGVRFERIDYYPNYYLAVARLNCGDPGGARDALEIARRQGAAPRDRLDALGRKLAVVQKPGTAIDDPEWAPREMATPVPAPAWVAPDPPAEKIPPGRLPPAAPEPTPPPIRVKPPDPPFVRPAAPAPSPAAPAPSLVAPAPSPITPPALSPAPPAEPPSEAPAWPPRLEPLRLEAGLVLEISCLGCRLDSAARRLVLGGKALALPSGKIVVRTGQRSAGLAALPAADFDADLAALEQLYSRSQNNRMAERWNDAPLSQVAAALLFEPDPAQRARLEDKAQDRFEQLAGCKSLLYHDRLELLLQRLAEGASP